jgi:hypothetical protein
MASQDINPHIVHGLSTDSDEELAHSLHPHSRAIFLQNVATIRASYARATELLIGDPVVKEAFPNGLPLVYALYPQLKPMRRDITGAEKFGGYPDIQRLGWMWYAAHPDHGCTLTGARLQRARWKSLVAHWPRCGCCHQPMAFLGQLDLTDWVNAIHALTRWKRGAHERDCRISGIGPERNCGTGAHRKWWYLFMCRDIHYDNPNSDVHVWLNNYAVPEPRVFPGLDDEEARKKAKEICEERDEPPVDRPEIADLVRRYCRAVQKKTLSAGGKRHAVDVLRHRPLTRAGGLITPQRVVGYHFRWELDYIGTSETYDLDDAVEEIVDANPDVFGGRGDGIKLFGAPRSQQDERRYWTGHGDILSGGPTRMAPLLTFDSLSEDVTVQIYADLLGDFYGHNLYGKADKSNT